MKSNEEILKYENHTRIMGILNIMGKLNIMEIEELKENLQKKLYRN